MATVDKLIVRIEADMKDLKRGLKQASNASKQSTTLMNRHFMKVKTQMQGVGKAIFSLKGALIGLGVGAGIRSLVKVGNDIESLQIRFETLFKSAEEGGKAFETMSKFASKVPFSLKEIQAGSGSLLSVADDAVELGELLEMTGTIAAATGLDFETTSQQIQRSLSAGIGAADLFRDKGVTAMLGFAAGTKVSLADTKLALEQFAADNEGITDKLANTFSGNLSMIGDKVFNFQRAINDAGFFAALKGHFKDLDTTLANNTEKLQGYAEAISDGLVFAMDALADAINFVYEEWDALLRIATAFVALKLGLLVITLGVGFVTLARNITTAKGAMMLFNAVTKKSPLGLLAIGAIIVAEKMGVLEKAMEKVKVLYKDLFEDEKFEEIDDIVVKGEKKEEKKKKDIFKEDFGPKTLSQQENIDLMQAMADAYRDLEDAQVQVNIQSEQEQENYEERQKVLQELGLITKDYADEIYFLKEALALGEITNDEYALSLGRLKVAMIESTEEGKIALQGVERVTDFLADSTADALAGMTDGWKGFRDGLKSIVRDIISDLLKLQAQQAITKTFGGGGSGGGGFDFGKILSFGSSFFGGGSSSGGGSYTGYGTRANGGSVTANQPYMVGEQGPEMFVPNTSGGVFTNRSLKNSGGGGATVNQTINIETGVAQTVRAELQSLMPQIKMETVSAVIDAKKRGGQMADTFA
tara:strand:- start:359 stop:2458 length:2100 start_codon:yes stop_codon:yes gene_type:complete